MIKTSSTGLEANNITVDCRALYICIANKSMPNALKPKASSRFSTVACLIACVYIADFVFNSNMGEPWITIFSKVQRPVQNVLRPAVWIPGLRNLHSCRETWTFKDGSHQENIDAVLSAINKVIAKDTSKFYWQVQPPTVPVGDETDSRKSVIRIFTFTRAEWLDITEITVSGNKAEAWAFSSGLLPLSIPLACVLNVPFFWFPFLDNGLNKKRLDRITDEMVGQVTRSKL